MEREITKEYLIELIGMADLLEAALIDMDKQYRADDMAYISKIFRDEFNRLCGEEELKRMRDEINTTN